MIRITLFDSFTFQRSTVTLAPDSRRAPKLFRALAFLVLKRSRGVSTREFAAFLQKSAHTAPCSGSLVKVTLHRLRKYLAPISDECLLVQNGRIFFSSDLSFQSDAEEFEAVCHAFKESRQHEEKLTLFDRALTLYRGRFLNDLLGDPFFAGESERYHKLYVGLLEEGFSLLMKDRCFREVNALAEQALAIDPYAEPFHYYRIAATLSLGEKALAELCYRKAEACFHELRLHPSHRIRRLVFSGTSCRTAKDALSLLDNLVPSSAERELSLLASARVLLRESYHLLLLTLSPDTDPSPLIEDCFRKNTLWARVSAENCLLISTICDEAFHSAADRLIESLAAIDPLATLDHIKINANP